MMIKSFRSKFRFKSLLAAIVISLVFVSALSTPVRVIGAAEGSADDINVVLDGKNLSFDVPPQIINGRTLVPLRVIFEALGASVRWSDLTQTVTAVRGNTTVALQIGSSILIKNGTPITLDVPAQLIDSRTMVPARAVAEAFGADVRWSDSTQTVTITTGETGSTGETSETSPGTTPGTLPDVLNLDAEPDAMFAVLLDTPAGLGEPDGVFTDGLAEEYGPNRFLYIIPLRDGIRLSIENIYVFDHLFQGFPAFEKKAEFTASRGEYYLINTYLGIDEEEESSFFNHTRIVAQDSRDQGVFQFSPESPGERSQYIITPGKAPDLLDVSLYRYISNMVAGTVWKYGRELGWLDEFGGSEKAITPNQLALSQSAYQSWIDSVMDMLDHPITDDAYADEIAAQERVPYYEALLFPNVKLRDLPQSDDRIAQDYPLKYAAAWTRVISSSVSTDGKTCSFVIGFRPYDAVYDRWDYYQVDWELVEPFNVYRPYLYRLLGVKPLQPFPPSRQYYEEFQDKYLGPQSVAALAEFDISFTQGPLDPEGVWRFGNTWLIKDTGAAVNSWQTTFVLLEDDGERITYLGALVEEGQGHAAK